MWFFPAVACVVALAFAASLVAQLLRRRRPYQASWAAALLMYAIASAALALGVAGDAWTSAEYRTFWLFGAVLNVPYLAMGEAYLLVKRRAIVDGALLLLLFATAFALNRVRTGVVASTALATDLPRGSSAWRADPFVLELARLYSYVAYAVLVGGASWSAWRMRAAPHLRSRFLGTLWIAVGATVVAAGSAFAAAGNLPGFALTITAGIVSMFWGFVLASRPVGDRPPRELEDART
jgi:hypothetical protein